MELSATRVIARPAEDVFAFLCDAANNPSWQRGMRSCEWTTPPPIGVGSVYEQEARFLGRTVVTTFRVEDHQPGRSITIASRGGSFPITVTRSVEPITESTSRVRAEITGEPGGFFKVAGPLLQRLAQRSVDRDYDRLVEILDTRPPAG